HVVAELPAFAQRVARDDRGSEERSHVDDLGVSVLMLEGEHRDRRALRLREIDSPVADVAQASSAALGIVRPVAILAAEDTAFPARDRVAVRVVFGGAIYTRRRWIVYEQIPRPRL